MIYTAKTDVGRKRENNEDNLYARIYDEDTALFVVADGLGGYSSGEVASKVAVNSIRDNFEVNIDVLKKSDEDKIKKFFKELVQITNQKIYSMQMSNPKYKGMGTTVVLVGKVNGKIYYESVGDSRLYYIDKELKKIEQITIDDTYVNELLKKNLIKKSEVETHPQKHILTKALGIFDTIDLDIDTFIRKDGYLLLCSDGLTNMLQNEDILEIISTTPFDNLAEKFVQRANANGGTDNITLICVEI